MDAIRTINNQDFAYWSWRGFVRAKFSSSAQIEGQQAQEISIRSEDRTHRTIVIGRKIAVETDDDVSLLYACPVGARKGALVGIVNHTTGRWVAMPQGINPLRLRPPWPFSWVRQVERFSLFGAVTLLSCVAAMWLHFFGEIRLTFLTWLLIGSVALALLWSLTVLADWREESGSLRILEETEEVLYELAYKKVGKADDALDEEEENAPAVPAPEPPPPLWQGALKTLPQRDEDPANSMQSSSSS